MLNVKSLLKRLFGNGTVPSNKEANAKNGGGNYADKEILQNGKNEENKAGETSAEIDVVEIGEECRENEEGAVLLDKDGPENTDEE